jgi:hypothetical protein
MAATALAVIIQRYAWNLIFLLFGHPYPWNVIRQFQDCMATCHRRNCNRYDKVTLRKYSQFEVGLDEGALQNNDQYEPTRVDGGRT